MTGAFIGRPRSAGSAKIGGKRKEWNARITEQIPDLRIAWQSEAGENTSGIVTFQPDGPDRTRVNLELFYDPKGFVESTGDAIGLVSHRVESDLERFKEFIEQRRRETGAWRGTIRDSAWSHDRKWQFKEDKRALD
jgi:uncharacterized membrane protein